MLLSLLLIISNFHVNVYCEVLDMQKRIPTKPPGYSNIKVPKGDSPHGTKGPSDPLHKDLPFWEVGGMNTLFAIACF